MGKEHGLVLVCGGAGGIACLQSTVVHPTLGPFFILIPLSASAPARTGLRKPRAVCLYVHGLHNNQTGDHLAPRTMQVQTT